MKIYAGIGSRETPTFILEVMQQLAYHLSKQGWMLRSGGAEGADMAFQIGAEKAKGKMEIFLPWNGFNNLKEQTDGSIVCASNFDNFSEAIILMKKYHPAPERLSNGAVKLQSRNGYQVLGPSLSEQTISDAIVCYTPNAKETGGTGQAIRLAKDRGIPIKNLGNPETLDSVKIFITKQNLKANRITIVNIHKAPKGTYEYCGRGSALGNSFPMRTKASTHTKEEIETERNIVCNNYDQWFIKRVRTPLFDQALKVEIPINFLNKESQMVIRLINLAKLRPISLGCCCAPKRCHCLTIKEFILIKLNSE